MINTLGRSVYLSSFDKAKDNLGDLDLEGSFVFTSFHISEEFGADYCQRAREMCRWLADRGVKIIADVSKKTLTQFEQPNILNFSKEMGISVLRIDYGFSVEEIMEIARHMPVAVNASTEDNHIAREIVAQGGTVYAIHNFYPRPETGLDEEFFQTINKRLQKEGVRVLAFIPGDETLRGPIFKGLPTLEKHRHVLPYVAYLDLVKNFTVDGVILGDQGLSSVQQNLIGSFIKTEVMDLPAELDKEAEWVYGQVYTVRPDSPSWLARFQESREYSTFGKVIEPKNCVTRARGSVTIDNIGYARYSGEIQLTKADLPADEKINVIGNVKKEYIGLLDSLHNGQKFRLVR